MEKLKITGNSMGRIVEKYRNKEGYIPKDEDVVSIIEELKDLIEMNRELNYLEDIREDIVNLKIEKDSKFNTIIKKDFINGEGLKEITVKFLEILDEQGLILILEPNNNLYIDIDYDRLVKILHGYSSLRFVGVIRALELIQENAIVNSEGVLAEENYKNLYEEIFVSTDFEKNPIRFKYMNTILSYLEVMFKIYKKK